MEKQKKKCTRVEDLDEEGVTSLLQRWELQEFVEFARVKKLDGRKLADVSEGIVKLWRPKSNAKKLILFIEDIKLNPRKYLENKDDGTTIETNNNEDNLTRNTIETNSVDNTTDKTGIESQYQTVKHRRKVETVNTHTTMSSVEELIRKIVPAKSFLYRNQQKADKAPSYLPMDSGAPKKKKIFRLSSYEYPFFDMRARFSKQENSNDVGYYSMKRNSRYYIARTYRKPENKPKYKSLSTPEELSEQYPEDHFYEDLCYNEVNKTEKEKSVDTRIVAVKPCIVKIQEYFQSLKVPFFKKHEMLEDSRVESEKESNSIFYENSDSVANMYDSVHVNRACVDGDMDKNQIKLPVEDYLEPVQLNHHYCNVSDKQKDDSLLGYILSIFENKFGIRRETNDEHHSQDSETDAQKAGAPSDDTGRKWPEDRKCGRTNMADRPLPVPVENEPYYMNVDRSEAQNLLRGQPDGTFILRPSSQPDHAYTLSVSCANTVHNVGVRRRPDGRLALGFPRRGELSFVSVTSLLRHHRKKRVLFVGTSGGDVIGATMLNDTPHYYQCPSNIPVHVPATVDV